MTQAKGGGAGNEFPSYAVKQISYRSIPVSYMEAGKGQPILMLHGAGPGTSATSNFKLVLEPMAERYHVYAMDLIGFGSSGRKPAPPYFDFAFWVGQAQAMLDQLPGDAVGIVGHSISGAIALRLAATNERVNAVLTTGAVGTRFPITRHLERLWTFPQSLADLRKIMEAAVYDASALSDAMLNDRLYVLNQDGYPDYFRQLFGGHKQALVNSWELSTAELEKIRCKVTMMHGRNDVACPYDLTTDRLSRSIPQADVVLLARCGHSPALEYPDKFMSAARLLFG
jgi:2-hydroxymuconate-semialdehyde hydrolase